MKLKSLLQQHNIKQSSTSKKYRLNEDISDSLETLKTTCSRCKTDLETALDQVDLGNDDAKTDLTTNIMVSMDAIIEYINDMQKLSKNSPDAPADEIVIENSKTIFIDNLAKKIAY